MPGFKRVPLAVLAAVGMLGSQSSTAALILLSEPTGKVESPQPESPSEDRYRKGIGALIANNRVAAAAAFKDSAALDPRNPRPLLGLAEMAVQDGKKEEALRHLTKAVEIAPRDSTARLAIGRFYALGGDIAKAEQHLKTSTSLNPRSFDAWASLADLYRQAMGKPVDAIAAYRQALKLNADHVAARVGLASALTSTGQRQEAVAEAKKLEGMAPQNAGVLRTVGRIYSLSGQFDDAMRVYDQVLKIDPKSTVTRLDRGDLYAGKSDWTRANAEYQAATTDPQTASVAHLKAGTMFERTEQWKNAEAAYLKAVQADPKNAFAYNNLAWLSAERRTRLVEALGWIDKAIALNPQMASFHDTRAWVLRASGDLPSAAKAMTVAASASPPQARFYYRLGLIYGEMGRQADAKAAMKKSLELDPEFTRAEDARRRQAAAK